MVVGQTVRLLVDKHNTKHSAICVIIFIHREEVYEVEFKNHFGKITYETVKSNEIKKA